MNRSILAAVVVSIAFSFVGTACNDGEPDTSGSGGEAGGSSLGGDSGSGGSGPTCGSSQTSCDGICTNLKSDPAHCGDCAIVCGAGEGCSNGECERFGCATGQVECSSECVSLQTDRRHCSECDKACASGELCSSGDCVTSCPDGLLVCGDTCVDPKTNRSYCGATDCEGSVNGGFGGGSSGTGMGEACEGDELCIEGACQVGCSEGQLVCGGMCVDPLTSSLFCGASDCTVLEGEGVACESGFACVAGECTTSCPDSQIVCDSLCIDPGSDRAHCGATDCSDASTSGEACEDGEVCSQGACKTSCPGSQIVCNDQCVNPMTDRGYCGATDCSDASTSGEACEDGEVCSQGACATSCPGDQIVCDEKCIDPDIDPIHCGATDCSAVPSSGVDCGSGQVCVMGACATSCPPGQQPCGAQGSEQCVDPTRDREYCGATDCSTGDNGEACASGEVCSNSACVTSCPMGQIECGGNCVDPNTDLDYCGATDCSDSSTDGTPCDSGNVCSLGLCSVSCVSGQINCGGKCVDPNTDNQYCGASGDCSEANDGTACTSGNVCANGACGVTCPSGQFECSGACVDPLTSPAHCGASDCNGTGGEVCGSGQACVGGQCVVFVQWQTGARVDTSNTPATTEQALATDSAGNAVLVFRQTAASTDDGNFRIFGSYYSASSMTWSAPVQLDSRAFKVRSLQVDMNDAGVAVAAWIADTASLQSSVVAARFSNGSWSSPVDVDGPVIEFPGVYVDNLGQGAIVYSKETDNVFNNSDPDWQVYGSILTPAATLGTTVALSDFVYNANPAPNDPTNFVQATAPRISGNSAGQGVVAYYQSVNGGGLARNVYAVRYTSSTGFAAATTKTVVNGALAGNYTRGGPPDVAVDASGRAHVVWSQTSGNYAPGAATPSFPTRAAVFANVFDGSAWGTAVQVTGSSTTSSVNPRVSANLGAVGLTYQRYTTAASPPTMTTSTPPTTYEIYGHRYVGSAWTSEQPLDASAQSTPQPLPSVAVGGTGDVHFVWTDGNSAATVRYSAQSATWSNVQNLAAGGTGTGAAQWPVLAATPSVAMFASWVQNVSGIPGPHIFVSRYE